jgi:hypothetical protein
MQFTGPDGRPDVSMARGTMFKEKGADISSQYENPNKPSQQFNMQPRQEMRGPQNTDIDNILAGLKPKSRTVEIQRDNNNNNMSRSDYGGDDSIISISSLKDMQNATGPKKSNRKQRNGSEKNIVALDI